MNADNSNKSVIITSEVYNFDFCVNDQSDKLEENLLKDDTKENNDNSESVSELVSNNNKVNDFSNSIDYWKNKNLTACSLEKLEQNENNDKIQEFQNDLYSSPTINQIDSCSDQLTEDKINVVENDVISQESTLRNNDCDLNSLNYDTDDTLNKLLPDSKITDLNKSSNLFFFSKSENEFSSFEDRELFEVNSSSDVLQSSNKKYNVLNSCSSKDIEKEFEFDSSNQLQTCNEIGTVKNISESLNNTEKVINFENCTIKSDESSFKLNNDENFPEGTIHDIMGYEIIATKKDKKAGDSENLGVENFAHNFNYSDCSNNENNKIRPVHYLRSDFSGTVLDTCQTYSKNSSSLNSTFVKSSLKRMNYSNSSDGFTSSIKKSKRGISFDSVSVYYFPRTQGFTCIPSQGGSTLGMSWNHSHIKTFSLGEHAAEQRRAHKQFCSQQFSQSQDWKEISNFSSEDSDSDEVFSDSEIDYENLNFLQPIPTRERRAMLRAAGIQKIDSAEKDECRSIRLSREFCGCTCQIICDPDRCICAQAGIKCQVDRMNFPCSCTRNGCANENGRIEFNPVRVRTHYIHTLMRLEMEKKKEEQKMKLLEVTIKKSQSNNTDEIEGNMINFSCSNGNFHSYYPQSNNFNTTTASSIADSCFNFMYSTENSRLLFSTSVGTDLHQSLINTANKRLNTTSPALDYCSQLSLSSPSVDCLYVTEYGNDLTEQDNQNFIVGNLNNSENNEGDVSYDSDSFIRLSNENFPPNSNNSSLQSENMYTSTETSEDTEKEESDSDNFGDIIKKTMVETVIA